MGHQTTGRNGIGKAVVLIGSLAKDKQSSISTVTIAFMDGLKDRYNFIPHFSNRRFGSTGHGRLGPVNVYYYVKNLFLWVIQIIQHRPAIAHYPMTSFWNLEKSLSFLMIARMLGAKTVGHLHGGAFLDFWNALLPQRKWLAAKELKRLDAMIVLSESWKCQIEAALGIDRDKVHVVNNPIDREFEESVIHLPVERGSRMILSLGVMAMRKGVFDLLEAARLVLPNSGFGLNLVGPEIEPGVYVDCENFLERHVLGECVHLAGGAWGECKRQLFLDASIFVLPSYFENFPLTVLEAAAAGLAIVATPVGALPEFFVHNESILFVQPGNSAQLAQSLRELMNDPEKRRRLGTESRHVFQTRLGRDSIMKALDSVYKSVLV